MSADRRQAAAPRLLLAMALALAAAAPGTARAWDPPPGFVVGSFRAGAFLPHTPELKDGKATVAVGVALGVRPLAWLTAELEGTFLSRDFAAPAGGSQRLALDSRAVAAQLRLHRAIGPVVPGLLAGAALLRTDGQAQAGLVAGAFLDVPLGETFAAGLDWRWLQAQGAFPDVAPGKLSLSGQTLSAQVRLYWP